MAETVEELGWRMGYNLRDFIFRRVDGSRACLYDHMRFQDEVLGSFAGPPPFVSKVHEANQ